MKETFKVIVDKEKFYLSVSYVGENSDNINPNIYYAALENALNNVNTNIKFADLMQYIREILSPFKEESLFVNMGSKGEDYTIYINQGKIEDYTVYKKFGSGNEIDIHYINEGENNINISIKNNKKTTNEDITSYINEELLPFLLTKNKRK